MSENFIFDGGWNIGVFVCLVQKCVVLSVVVAERRCGRDDVGGVAKEEEDSVEERHAENEIVSQLMDEYPLSVANKSTHTVCQCKYSQK